ncbi:MAG: prkC 29 [Planctomycetaceae bacterium]|nr:prkC 29 [Planctomycetaceae bacterium]
MSDPQKPNRRLPSAEQQRQHAAASRETNRPADSTPAVAGPFVNLPAMFGRYQVEKLLGRGAMGAVYLATDTQLDRPVALKIPKVAASGSKKLLQRLETEAKAAAKLDHPSLCKVFDAGAVGEQCFIAMQYIEGETLKSQLEAKSKPVAEAVSLILQLADGLSEAHALGIIHRDLKPENIMINRRGTPVIMDFGLAKFSTIGSNAAATQAGTILGSPAYMSPEQASGNSKEIDQRSDIYALGTILFEMLTGQWPFSGSAMQILGQKSLLDAPAVRTIQPDLPPQLAATCDKMLAKEPLDRYQDLAEVIADLNRIDLNRSPQTSVVRPPQPIRSPSEIGENAVAEPADVRIVSIGKRLQSRPAPISRRTATTSWLQQLRGWWDGQTPAFKWTSLGGAGALLVVLGVIVLFQTRHGTLQIEIADPNLSVRFDGITAIVQNGKQTYSVTPTDKHTLEFLQDGVAIESATRELTLKRNEKLLVTFKLLDGKVVIDGLPVSQELKGATTNVAQSNPANSKTDEPKSAPAAPPASHQWPADAPQPAIAPFNKDQAKAYQEAWAKYLKVDVEYTNSLGMKFRLIPPGEFLMGSTQVEVAIQAAGVSDYWQKYIQSEAPQHKVILTQPIYLGTREVTQDQYNRVMVGNPSWFVAMGGGKDKLGGKDTSGFPVEMVSWNDAAEFCLKLSQQEELQPCYVRAGETVTPQDGTGYRLPTEAEWEFACRAGTTRKYWTGDQEEDLGITGWFPANSQQRTHAVGELESNPFGIHDVHGNIWEWVQDWWEPTYYRQFQTESALDPSGPAYTLSERVVKGGSWYEAAANCRAASRDGRAPTARSHDIGFRVMLTVDAGRKLPKAAVSTAPTNSPTAPANTLSDADIAAGWKQLFNGKDLTGWRQHPESTGIWSVEGEAIVGRGRDQSHLFTTTGDYTDFHIRVEAKINGTGNSGVCFRTSYFGTGKIRDRGYEAAIEGNPNLRWQTGSLMHIDPRGEVVTPLVKPREWFTMEVIAVGNHITIKVNGQVTIDFVDSAQTYKRGCIALQQLGDTTEVQFRKVEIKDLSTTVTDPPAPSDAGNRPQIPADVTLFRTKRYKVFTESLSWHEARQKCRDLGGRLADVRNASENTFLAGLAARSNVDTVWLGATDEVTEGRWLWSDGKEMKYQNWSVGGKQPNNKGNSEHYLIMTLKFATGEWHDQPAKPTQYKPGYICEWDKPQLPVAAENEWKSVFNGNSLAGWTQMFAENDTFTSHRIGTKGWSVVGGEIVCETNQPGWLKLNKTYGDCEFDFEFYMPYQTNSGLLVRYPGIGKVGLEIQLVNVSEALGPLQKCGGLYGVIAPSQDAFKAGSWNHMQLEVHSGRIKVRLNDQLIVDAGTADYEQLRVLPKDGYIGLYNWKGQAKGCKFRNIRIKEFKPDAPQEFITTATGLKYKLLRKTNGKHPRVGDKVLVNYRGTLDDGTEFDTSYGKQPVTFALTDVVRGWMEGMQYCPVGGKIELEIPPTLGYGEKGTGVIPGDATLHFTIELLKIQ